MLGATRPPCGRVFRSNGDVNRSAASNKVNRMDDVASELVTAPARFDRLQFRLTCQGHLQSGTLSRAMSVVCRSQATLLTPSPDTAVENPAREQNRHPCQTVSDFEKEDIELQRRAILGTLHPMIPVSFVPGLSAYAVYWMEWTCQLSLFLHSCRLAGHNHIGQSLLAGSQYLSCYL